MVLFRSLLRLLVRVKGRTLVVLAAFRLYQRLPRFAQRRVRKRAIRAALPRLVSKVTEKTHADPH